MVNTFLENNDEALILQPSYAMYKFYAELAGAAVGLVDYRAEKLAFPLEELLNRITPATRAIFISNPNNPTGTGTTPAALDKILTRAPNAAVFVDEAYYEFCGVTMLALIKQHSNLFVSRTFSKTYGMAALRCGCLFSQAGNMAFIKKAQSPYSVNMLAAMAARIAVQDRRFIEEYVLEVLAARELLYVGLEKLQIAYVESQANFVLIQVGDRAVEIRDELRSRGILVRDRSYEIPGSVRITVGTRDQIENYWPNWRKFGSVELSCCGCRHAESNCLRCGRRAGGGHRVISGDHPRHRSVLHRRRRFKRRHSGVQERRRME